MMKKPLGFQLEARHEKLVASLRLRKVNRHFSGES